ncbi:23S rRNA (adenine(1618)-N(6))-methyltransferase RlmF [Aestuariirhabdus sp. LZHN29]|uniref:23S rRNA (adenine(1618)-N(6))-methyltransferase RlmF n=1 Tax=Aestuariirhabdus sp. LZHN29 TaxID=3417462 RepID=UPI003CEE43DD
MPTSRRPPRSPRASAADKGTKPSALHPRNPHTGRYDLVVLADRCPELSTHIIANPRGEATIDFANAEAVRCLNQAILAHHYGITHWQLPAGYLCPPIPGRADLIHYVADLLARCHGGQPPKGKRVRVLDIGTGANCIYPILGVRSYGWSFLATDIDPVSIAAARAIVDANPSLRGKVTIVQQQPGAILQGLLNPQQRIEVSLCNPPFFASAAEARAANQRKRDNLSHHRGDAGVKGNPPVRNFGGQQAELWCPGGERRFLQQMIAESRPLAAQVCWFTSLVSNGDNLAPLKKQLRAEGVAQLEVIPMRQGQKQSRMLAWSFLSPAQQIEWVRGETTS